MEFQHKHLPHHSYACSQFSIAMATATHVDEVAQELGWGAMSTNGIRDYLVRKGYSNGEKLVGREMVLSENRMAFETGEGVLVITNVAEGYDEGHAVAYCDGIIYDPNNHIFRHYTELLEYYNTKCGGEWRLNVVMATAPVKVRVWAVNPQPQKEEAV